MADEPTNQTQTGEGGEVPAENMAENKAENRKSRKLLLVIVLAVFLSGLGGGYFLWQQSTASAVEPEAGIEEEAPSAEVYAFLPLDTFVVNLAGAEGREFLRVGVELGLEHDPADGHGGGAPVPQIRDTILAVLTTWSSDDLLTTEGKERLKADLLDALNKRLGHLGVQAVYFNEFIVQR